MEHCPISMRVVKSQLAHSLAALAALAEAGRGARLTDVVAALGAPKSSVQRLLQQLAEEGWVEQDPETGYYRLTVRMAVLGQRYLYTTGIVDATQGILQTVASKTRELARLTIVDTDRLVWIGSAQGAPSGLMYVPADPARIVSYATANGKAWLATLPEKEANRIAQRDGIEAKKPPIEVGPNALRSLAALKRDLALVRTRGYAISDEEGERGVAAIAVAILDPESGQTLGTTSVAGPVARLTKDHHARIADELAAAAQQLAKIWPLKPAAQKSVAGRLA
jgi:DNA-binding IclR family transcriptional regulator